MFALKGGTAINLFVRDMPRLSVDIDLTYLPIEPRDISLKGINDAMLKIGDSVTKGLKGARVTPRILRPENIASKLDIEFDGARIKIEVTPVSRGCVFDPSMMSVSEMVEKDFGYADTQVVSFPDLYAGKIVAALDRQHPRDLFDVRALLATEGLSDDLRVAFVAYMLSHNRPMSEVLAPTRRDIALEFERGFVGMTAELVLLDDLLEAREAIIADAVGNMPDAHRHFLVAFKRGEPDWDLLGLPHVADLPAVKWRQQNYDKLSSDVRAREVAKLERVLLGRVEQ
ncbi:MULTISPECIES: nucleotidyl transferase AbiEii/AbiGii toxin family protein [unclassified Haematobacter]|uniref:nucleotidyl transferase AbiEii/AbiGii toxin family protein n=1 Tax=unclassified Haematobacter TaxID=2640585 RepID=UPI0025BAB9FF|nr:MULTISPECIES: nucleotidyl transferase AbiEii/AbiGii toxin family protein [unclassified Haematobacter]